MTTPKRTRKLGIMQKNPAEFIWGPDRARYRFNENLALSINNKDLVWFEIRKVEDYKTLGEAFNIDLFDLDDEKIISRINSFDIWELKILYQYFPTIRYEIQLFVLNNTNQYCMEFNPELFSKKINYMLEMRGINNVGRDDTFCVEIISNEDKLLKNIYFKEYLLCIFTKFRKTTYFVTGYTSWGNLEKEYKISQKYIRDISIAEELEKKAKADFLNKYNRLDHRASIVKEIEEQFGLCYSF